MKASRRHHTPARADLRLSRPICVLMLAAMLAILAALFAGNVRLYRQQQRGITFIDVDGRRYER